QHALLSLPTRRSSDLNLVLLDIDEALRRIHQEVDFFKQERSVRQQGFNVAINLAAGILLLRKAADMALQKRNRTLRIHQAQPDRSEEHTSELQSRENR